MADILQTTFNNTFSGLTYLCLLQILLKFACNWQYMTVSSCNALILSSHYLNQWWPSSLMHNYVTWSQRVNMLSVIESMTELAAMTSSMSYFPMYPFTCLFIFRYVGDVIFCTHCFNWEHVMCKGDHPYINSLSHGRYNSNSESVISEYISWIKFVSTACEISPSLMPQNTFADKSTLVQVMAWCHQATSHYLSQCWSRSIASVSYN